MKRILSSVFSTVGMLAPLFAQAQGTLYLSNLGQPSIGSAVVASDAWFAQLFITGTNFNGYTLNSIQLLMDGVSGSPSGFSVMIYNSSPPHPPFNPSSTTPVNSLGRLSGPDASVGGVFAYTASGITLSPATLYFVVLTAATPVSQGSYVWQHADNTIIRNPTDPWELEDIYYGSTDGSSWPLHLRQGVFQLGLNATAVPEPATYVMVGLGLVCLSVWRARPKVNVPNP
jgi:hypothetical protein